MSVRYVQHESIPADEMIDLLGFYFQSERRRIVLPNGQNIPYRKNTLLTLSVWKGTSCQGCGLEANTFIMQHQKEVRCNIQSQVCQSSCVNLYWVGDDGEQVLFTKDHIIPRSKEGWSAIWNYQLMCEGCNMSKGDTLPTEEELERVSRYRFMHPRELQHLIRSEIAERHSVLV